MVTDLRRGLPLAGWDRFSVWGFDTASNRTRCS